MEFIAERRVGTRLRFYAFSCVHFGDRYGHDAELWTRFLKSVERDDQAVVIGCGDYTDWSRTSHRVPLKTVWGEDDKAQEEYDSMLLHQVVYPFVDTVRTHCPTFAKKCAVMVEGNHHGTFLSHHFQNGRTTTEEICRLLGVRYGGLSAWVRMTCYRSRGKAKLGSGHNLHILVNHSTSSSGKLAYSLAAAQRKVEGWRGVDVFLSANDHQLGHVLRQEIGCTNRGRPRPMEYQQVIGKVGSFQKGYQMGAQSASYVEKRLLTPAQLGWLAFDAWMYYRELTPADKAQWQVGSSPEVWRFGNFSA